MSIYSEAIEGAKALLRGDKRVHPKGTRGRVYENENKDDLLAPKASGKFTIEAVIVDGETGKQYTPEEWKNK